MRWECMFPTVTEKMLAQAILTPKVKFALFPTRLHDGTWLWLERYVRAPIGLYFDKDRGGELRQFRVGGGWDEDGEYFPHRNFDMRDERYMQVWYLPKHLTPYDFLTNKLRGEDVQV